MGKVKETLIINLNKTKMKKLLFFLVVLSTFTISCSNNKSKLKEKLDQYISSYKTGDYVKMSSFVLPSQISEMGGTESFVNTMNSLPETFASLGMVVDIKKLEFGEIGEIYEKSNFLISVVPTTLPIEINGMRGTITGSVICFSEDKGETWYFIEGNDEGRSAISNTNPEIIQMITVPAPELKVNGKVLVQKGGQWVEK
jgi:hypothetical protein